MPSHPIIPWPDHWYNNNHCVKCPVDGCEFTTHPNGLIRQFEDMKSHCSGTPGVEHAILVNMLGQRKCAMCSYRVSHGHSSSNKLRKLFLHERAAHGSDSMSRICGFVVLAREGRIDGRLGQSSQKIAFDRMVEKLQGFEQPVAHLLCQKEGLPHSLSNLQQILSTDYLRPVEDSIPVWWPVYPERFLWLLRPNDNDPADYQWGRVWTRLRQMYGNGHL